MQQSAAWRVEVGDVGEAGGMVEGVGEAEAMLRVPLEAEDEEIVGEEEVPLEEGEMVVEGAGDVVIMLEVSK